MTRWGLSLSCLLLLVGCLQAQGLLPGTTASGSPGNVGERWNDSVGPPSLLVQDLGNTNNEEEKKQGESKNGHRRKGKGNNNDNNNGSENLTDYGFLIEEAYNVEPGVVAHIFNWINTWDREAGVRRRDFTATYTMALPLGTRSHQFSFTTQFLTQNERLPGGPVVQQGDIGDTFLNYRYQFLDEDEDDFVSAAPRFSLILPTGDERLGLGAGTVGYEFNLPISKETERFTYHFNAGFTYLPGAEAPLASGLLSPHHDLHGYNLGGAAYWLLQPNFDLFVEVLALWDEQIDRHGFRDDLTQVLVNPGFVYAICQLDQVEWVVGLSVPIGLTRDTPDIGIFAYMSIGHDFRKNEKNGKDNEK